jgi:chromatin structure-remodeling complex subunit RSC9
MAPATHPEWPDAPVDRDAFYQDLQEFHRQRGTTLDAIPKVSTQPIDLYDLFRVVQENGGYDEVSGKKLEWRRLAERQYSLGGNQNAAAYAFQLKSLFYRNLAAYAIARVYKQDPPPKDILEDITAKGGNLLKRTRESFQAEQALRHKPVQPEEESGSERERESREDNGARTSRE